MNLIPILCRTSIRSLNTASFVISNNSLIHFASRHFSSINFAMAQYKITHVIFDFDGVLLDTERIFYNANAQCFKHFGSSMEYNRQLKQGQMGRPLNEGVEWLMNNTDLSKKGITNNDYIKFYNEIVDKMLDNLSELPGSTKLINHLHANKIPMAICTGSGGHEFELKTRKWKHMLEKIPIIITASDPEVKHGKPAPDPYLVAIKRFSPTPNPENVLVFEDSVNGVYSALAAKCTTIMVPQEEFKPDNWAEIHEQIKPPKTADILTSLLDLDLKKYALPPFSE